jgi:hypothetical protein
LFEDLEFVGDFGAGEVDFVDFVSVDAFVVFVALE